MNEQHKDKPTRTIQDALKEAIKRLPHEKQKPLRELLKAKGVLKGDDKAS
jgi:hypothetical protein